MRTATSAVVRPTVKYIYTRLYRASAIFHIRWPKHSTIDSPDLFLYNFLRPFRLHVSTLPRLRFTPTALKHSQLILSSSSPRLLKLALEISLLVFYPEYSTDQAIPIMLRAPLIPRCRCRRHAIPRFGRSDPP